MQTVTETIHVHRRIPNTKQHSPQALNLGASLWQMAARMATGHFAEACGSARPSASSATIGG
jgi:hypothetical protein